MDLSSESKLLVLTIGNYEFFDAEDEYDRNWLMVHVFVEEPSGRWSFNEPFLLTSTLPMWAEWFESLHSRSESDMLPDYDGVLWFEFKGVKDNLYHLTARFYQEGLPPWAKVKNKRIYKVDFQVPENQIKDAAESFRAYINQFPPR